MKGPEGMSNVESFEEWKKLRDEAPAGAERLIADIPGFYVMAREVQVVELQKKIDALSSDNKNRFLAKEVAREQAKIQEHIRHERELARIAA